MSSFRRRAAIGFILTTVTLDILAMSLVIPVLPRLVMSFEGGSAVMAAHVLAIFGTAWALMQFFFSPVQGALSDRFGRRPVVLLSNAGLGLDYVLMALAPSLSLLFVGRVISGICAASFSSATAYIADITPPEQRAAKFGMVGLAFGFGFVLGPALGGILGQMNPRLPFWVSAALSLTNFAFGYFILPESLAPENRSAWSWRKANPIGSLKLLRSRAGLLGLAGVSFLLALANNAMPAVTVLYVTYRYNWTQKSVGYMLAGFGITSAIVGAGLTGPVVKRLGEYRALLTGIGFGVAGMLMMGLAPTGAIFLASIPVLALWGFAQSALSGQMSRLVGSGEQAQLAGANSSIMAIAGLVGPALYTESFAFFAAPGRTPHLPGAPYLIGAMLLAAGFFAAIVADKPREAAALEPAPLSVP